MLRNFFTICLFLFATAVVAQKPQLTISPDQIELIITERTTDSQLKKIQKQLKDEAQVNFQYRDIIVNSKKLLSKITIEVKAGDSVSGSGTLMLSNLYEVGFILNRNADSTKIADNRLIIGNLREKEIKLD